MPRERQPVLGPQHHRHNALVRKPSFGSPQVSPPFLLQPRRTREKGQWTAEDWKSKAGRHEAGRGPGGIPQSETGSRCGGSSDRPNNGLSLSRLSWTSQYLKIRL